MVNPINYAMGGPDPVEQLFQGVEFGTGLRQAEQDMQIAAAQEKRAAEMQPLALEQAQLGNDQRRLAIEAAQREQRRQEEFSVAMGGLAELGPSATLDDYQRVSAQFPEFGRAISETWQTLDENRQRGISRRLLQIGTALKGGSVDTALELADEYADAAENSGDPAAAATARSIAEAIRMDPNAGLSAIGMAITATDPDNASKLFSPARVQSSQIVEGRVAVQQMSDGTVRVVDTATNRQLTGQEAADAIRMAEEEGAAAQGLRSAEREGGTLEARIAQGEQAKAAEGLGGMRSAILTDAGDTISGVNSSLRNYDRAIAAIDEGASAGIIYNRLPALSKDTAELRNALDSLGLDVIGSVTFGALSEGELRLAMETAAPRNLGPEELRDWLVERREAQRKVRESLLEMQAFLADPENTLQDWYARVREADEGASPAISDSEFKTMLQEKLQAGGSLTADERKRLMEIADRETGGGQ